jgi:heme-degrading monooxygenase HmoA
MAVTLIRFFEAEPSADAGTVYRALRRDVPFRFVVIGGDQSAPYEVIREDGSVDDPGGTVLIEPFEVPADRDDEFLSGWEKAHAVVATRPGYLGTRLHRATGPADFRFVEVARWSSPLMFSRTLQTPEFREASEGMGFRSHPALYEVVPR